MPKKTEKRVKAWAVVSKEGVIRSHGIWETILNVATREQALDLHEAKDKIIPCTITYTPPSQGKGKKKANKLAKK